MDAASFLMNDQFAHMNSELFLAENITAVLFHTISKRDLHLFLEWTRLMMAERSLPTGIIQKTAIEGITQLKWVHPVTTIKPVILQQETSARAAHLMVLIKDIEQFNLSLLLVDGGSLFHPLLDIGTACTVVIMDTDLSETDYEPYLPELHQVDVLLILGSEESSSSSAMNKFVDSMTGKQNIIDLSNGYALSGAKWLNWLTERMNTF